MIGKYFSNVSSYITLMAFRTQKYFGKEITKQLETLHEKIKEELHETNGKRGRSNKSLQQSP
jgi:hypothetical protein